MIEMAELAFCIDRDTAEGGDQEQEVRKMWALGKKMNQNSALDF